MIRKIIVKNFRNFDNFTTTFSDNKNFIIGNNGVGKTNILEAVSLIFQKNILGTNVSDLINENENFAFLEVEKNDGKIFTMTLDKKQNKKNLLINSKKSSKKKFIENLEKIIIFQPMDMNLMYLGPSLRRKFIDDILENSYEKYGKIMKEYKNIIINRNKTLKNIKDGKSQKDEINFWNIKMIETANNIYFYRNELNKFINDNIETLKQTLNYKIENLNYKYISKVNNENIKENIKSYLEKNIDRDIILGKTHIGPHIDDFDIELNGHKISNFASRGETKSIILGLKILESRFIKQKTDKKIIFLIDDLFSELDKVHEKLLLNEINNKQSLITSINSKDDYEKGGKIIYL